MRGEVDRQMQTWIWYHIWRIPVKSLTIPDSNYRSWPTASLVFSTGPIVYIRQGVRTLGREAVHRASVFDNSLGHFLHPLFYHDFGTVGKGDDRIGC